MINNQILFYQYGSGLDPDAFAFITAAGITDGTQKIAVNYLVRQLKDNLIWTKMSAIYPLVGGNATSHKFNLKDPRDLNAAFRLAFNGTFTHNSNGIQGNGSVSNAHAVTFLNSSTQLPLNNTHISAYSRTNSAGNFGDIGNIASESSDFAVIAKWGDNNSYFDCYNTISDRLTVSSQVNSLGLFMTNRTSNVMFNAWKNGIKVAQTTTGVTSLAPNLNIVLCGVVGSVGLNNYSTRNYSFFSIGQGFSDSEATILYNIVQQYQTILGRQV